MSRIIGEVSFIADGLSGEGRSRAGYTSDSRALTRYHPTSALDGGNGFDAPQARNGEDAGDLRIRLRRNPGHGFFARDLRHHDDGQEREIPVGYDVVAFARGGKGENGGVGGDGENGQAGWRGRDATQKSDATSGGRGGDGGDGGYGTNGGHGGHGGNVVIRVSESDMHLAYAVRWDVNGGRGGLRGRHGKGGKGARGGKGGSGISWKEVTGSEWRCAPGCNYNNSQAVARTGYNDFGQLQGGRALQIYIQDGMVSDGSTTIPIRNVGGTLPASIVPSFVGSSSALMIQSNALSTGGHSSECGERPTYTRYSKPPGSDGPRGQNGVTPSTDLFSGNDGRNGTGLFLVVNADGTRSSYGTAFDIALEGFEIIDENEDGCFEPGECAVIRNIRIRNSGAMPTPKFTNIPMTVLDPESLEPINGRSTALIPRDIPRDESRTAAQSIWAHISLPVQPPDPGTMFLKEEHVKLRAIIPDLERSVRSFDSSQLMTIQYPLCMDLNDFMWLEAMPIGSKGSFRWTILNRSTKALGCQSQSRRNIVTAVSCQPIARVALGRNELRGTMLSRCQQEIDHLDAGLTRRMEERVKILEEAEEYSKIEFEIVLYATPVTTAFPQHRREDVERVTIQTQNIVVQTSNKYRYDPRSAILLGTSFGVTGDLFQAWRGFIPACTKTSMDVWNVSHYGAFTLDNENDTVLSRYRGKTVVCLDYNPFPFCGTTRSMIDFVDPIQAMPLSQSGTRFLFLISSESVLQKNQEERLRELAFAPAMEGDHASIANEHRFRHVKELVRHIIDGHDSCSICTRHDLRFLLTAAWSARWVVRVLKKRLPLDRFVVTKDEMGIQVQKCVSDGQGFLLANIPSLHPRDDLSGLNAAEAFSLVTSLTFKARLDILQDSQLANPANAPYSNFVVQAARLSVLFELHEQIQAMSRSPRWSHHLFNFRPKDFCTTPVQGLVHDRITATLNHDIMNPPVTSGQNAELSEDAKEILSSMILSARCQNFRQLLSKWVMPVKRTRSLFRRNLQKRVGEQISSSVDGDGVEAQTEKKKRAKEFSKRVTQKLRRPNHLSRLNERFRDLADGNLESFHHLIYGLDDAMPTSVYLRGDRVEAYRAEKERARRQRDQDRLQIADKKVALGYEDGRPDPEPEPIRHPGLELDIGGADLGQQQDGEVRDVMVEEPLVAGEPRGAEQVHGHHQELGEQAVVEVPGVREAAELERTERSHPELDGAAIGSSSSRYRIVNPEVDGGREVAVENHSSGNGIIQHTELATRNNSTRQELPTGGEIDDAPDPPEVDISGFMMQQTLLSAFILDRLARG